MKAGYLLAVEGCMPSATGARVRLSGGNLTVTDGPFTESKEVIGGLAILQASSKEEALELVKDFIRVAGDGECELRQIFEADQGVVKSSLISLRLSGAAKLAESEMLRPPRNVGRPRQPRID